MEKNKKYVTQLTGDDLREIAATVNMVQGAGIRIERNGDNVTIMIDQSGLASMIQSFCQQQNIPGGYANDPRRMTLDLGVS